MTTITSTVNAGFDFTALDFGQGLTSFNFGPFPTQVTGTSSTTYEVLYGGGVVSGEYSGTGLTFGTVTQGGVTLEAPDGGRLTGYVERWGPGESYVKTLDLPAADFFAVSLTPDDRDNLDLFEASLAGDDVIDMNGEGDDRIKGLGGNDEIAGGAGDDALFGDDLAGTATGRAGADTLRGEGGDDRLAGGGRRDELRGGPGNDTLLGGRGDDLLVTGGGDDEIAGGRGADRIRVRGDLGGTDVIRDFEPGVDVLVWAGDAGRRFADLTETTAGGRFALTDGARVVAFDGLASGDVDAGDVTFVA